MSGIELFGFRGPAVPRRRIAVRISRPSLARRLVWGCALYVGNGVDGSCRSCTVRISRDLFRFGLSSAQNELLRAQQSLAELAMNIAQYTELVGRIDVERFQEVISEQVARHRAFQVRFERDGDDIVGVYDPSLSTRSEYVDLRGLDDSAGEALRRMRADFSARAGLVHE